MASNRDSCTCGHLALDHHYSKYHGHTGENARGKCAVHGCPCLSYAVAP